jgi:hypothetical protein
MSDEEHKAAIKCAVDTVAGRVPVIAGTGSNDTNYGIQLTKEAQKLGADAALVVTPYYNKCTPDGLVMHYKAIANSVDIPLVLYNVPSRTNVNISPEVLYRLADQENIVAVKECNLGQVPETYSKCGDRYTLYSGEDGLAVPMLSLGAKGVISVVANLIPEFTHTMIRSYLDGDIDNRWYGGGSRSDDYTGTVDRNASGTGHVDTDTDHKGWGASIGFGASTSNSSGDETRVIKSSKVDIDGMAVGNRPRGLADMRRLDYVRAGRECNYDYVFVLTLSNGKGKVYGHDFVLFNTNTVTKNVWLRVRLIDVSSGNYLYRNDIATSGKTHNGHINGRVLERSVANAMKEAMDDIKVSER